ncbi:AtzG-like protein [Bradyrhizobium canariense]|uniref:DUF4089 domain-containing protein n=1 Tax=Bradyrhizobium canariense TaxID=255045 RepID=A0A1H2BHU7_9BRAD|nr:AtzG-like protein [Bradyrhizobium canariense]SDT57758.1 Protein of unknown function [Bradyrhizobium canariense]
MPDPLEDYVEAASKMLNLKLEDAAEVRAALEAVFKFAALVDGFPLPDEAVAAAMFAA